MTIFLFSNDVYEKNAIACIKSLESKITDDIRIVYYTLGFKTDFIFKNLITHEYPINPIHKRFNFYKPELCLYTIEHYNDDCYLFMDIDFILSKRLDLNSLKHNELYPLASFGPVEFPCIWEGPEVYTETLLQKYFGMPNGNSDRTMRYVWSCVFSFNNNCIDFLEEWQSMCVNQYLLKNQPKYFPYQDEPAFNVCLWKRGATKNLGFGFLNTVDVKKFIFAEENELNNFCFGESLDVNDFDWECVQSSNKLIGYHGFKKVEDIDECTKYLNSNKNEIKQLFIIDCYADTKQKFEILKKTIESTQKIKIDILLVTHCIVPEDIISMVKYHIYDKDNTFNEVNFHTIYSSKCPAFDMEVWTAPDMNIKSHEFPIIKAVRNALGFAKIMGYDSFLFTEYDSVFTEADVAKFHKFLFTLYKYDKKFIVLQQSPTAVDTIFFAGKVNDVYEMWDQYFPKTIEEYNQKFTYRWPYSLEVFFKEAIDVQANFGVYVQKPFTTYFDVENKNISRVGPLTAGILPDLNNDKYYLYVSNKDNISYNVKILDNGVITKEFSIFNYTFPVMEMKPDSTLTVEFYMTDATLYKSITLTHDSSLKDWYKRCGYVLLKQ
jgi:hypothetical protein